jgi:hypothetical protein
MRVRSVANPSAPASTVLGDVPNGQAVTVLATGLPSQDGSQGEWWQVQSSVGTGYTRAVDPTGYVNWIVSGPTTAGVGAFAHPDHAYHHALAARRRAAEGARRAWAHAVQGRAHPAQVEMLRRRYMTAAHAAR